MARLLWMLEQLMYDDILRGTGWGRKRGWFRDSLDKCRTLEQVHFSSVRPLIWHSRPSLGHTQTVILTHYRAMSTATH